MGILGEGIAPPQKVVPEVSDFSDDELRDFVVSNKIVQLDGRGVMYEEVATVGALAPVRSGEFLSADPTATQVRIDSSWTVV